MRRTRVLLSGFLVAMPALLAQHELVYSKTDVEIGSRLFAGTCSYCHGPDGDQVAGVDLAHNRFKHAVTDDDLLKVIRDGVPAAGMPAQRIQEPQIKSIIAYLRSMASAPESAVDPNANPAHGKALFESSGCLNCHRVYDRGSQFGPNLTDIGSRRRAADLKDALLEPNKEVLPENQIYHVVMRDGTDTNARILNQDSFTVQLVDRKNRLLSLSRSELKEFTPLKASPMPSYQSRLSAQDQADLVAFLVSSKGVK